MTDGVDAPALDAATGLPVTAAPSAEYVAATLAANHSDPVAAPAQAQSANKRPDHVPEKFWDPVKGEARWDDLAKSYAELEKRGPADAPAAEKTPEELAAEAAAALAADPTKASIKVERKAGDPNPLTDAVTAMATAYAADGAVTDEQIKAVEDLGLPRNVIDTYMAGLKALETVSLQGVHTAAGGQDKFTAAQTWAGDNLSDADLAYYNANVDNSATQVQTVEWLMAKFNAARPSEGKLLDAPAGGAAVGDTFKTQEQVEAAMTNPRYKVDPDFRQATAEKLLRSRRAGTLTNTVEHFQRTR